MDVEKNCETCKFGLKPMSFPECAAEKCDENYSNWSPDPEDGPSGVLTDDGAGSCDFPC